MTDLIFSEPLKQLPFFEIGSYSSDYSVRSKGGLVTRSYSGNLPSYYNVNGNMKPCLTYFLTILYEELDNAPKFKVLNINILCMPNGDLVSQYGARVFKAGKNPDKVRFNFSEVEDFELLNDPKPKRIRIAYFNEDMDEQWKTKLKYLKGVYDEQRF